MTIDILLRIPLYYFYGQQYDQAITEIEIIESLSNQMNQFSHIEDTKRKIYQGLGKGKEAIISGVKSYLFSYSHCFSDFFTGYDREFKAVKLGIRTQEEQEGKNRKAKDFGYRCSLRFYEEKEIDKMIKNITKKSIYSDPHPKEKIKKYLIDKLNQGENIDFTNIEKDLLNIMLE